MLAELITLAAILLICFVLSRMRSDTYSGIMLHEKQTEIRAAYDVSLTPGSREAVELSQNMIEFCLNNDVDNSTANRIGVLAEEIVENIRLFNSSGKKPVQVDLICRITCGEIRLSVRDNGAAFDAAIVDDDCEDLTNLKMIHSIADEVRFTRTLGMNNVLIVCKARERTEAFEWTKNDI